MKRSKGGTKTSTPFETLKSLNDNPEENLFKAVILQMLSDLMTKSKSDRYLKNKNVAEKWFFTDNEDFNIICENANLEPRIIKKLAKVLFKKDPP